VAWRTAERSLKAGAADHEREVLVDSMGTIKTEAW
jgi:hypothetical protein